MKPLRSYHVHRQPASPNGFTFEELLVVVVTLCLLSFMLFPARADSRAKSKSIRCVDNMRQIMNATLLYTRDNHDFFPPNEEDSNAPAGHAWVSGHVGVGGSSRFNPDIIADPKKCLITAYVNTNVSLFRCTADLSVGPYQGINPALLGKSVPVARSIAMNQAVGTLCQGASSGVGHSGIPTLAANGPWMDGSHTHRRNSPWRTYGKLSEVIIPGPAQLWVMLEEDRFSINDGGFGFIANSPEWIDFPSTLHDMSGVIGFADSHVEIHKWVNKSTVVPTPVSRVSVPGSTDWVWLKERTSAQAP